MKENFNSILSSMKLKCIFPSYNEDGKRRRVEADRRSDTKPLFLQRKTRGSRVSLQNSSKAQEPEAADMEHGASQV